MSAEERVLRYVFEIQSEEGLRQRLEEVLVWLESSYRANRDTWSISKGLLQRICAQLEKRGMLTDLMLNNPAFERSPQDAAGSPIIGMDVLLGQGDVLWYAWQSLTAGACHYVGAAAERSVNFALRLLEDILPVLKANVRARAEGGHVRVVLQDVHGRVLMERRVSLYGSPEDTLVAALPSARWIERWVSDSVVELDGEHGRLRYQNTVVTADGLQRIVYTLL